MGAKQWLYLMLSVLFLLAPPPLICECVSISAMSTTRVSQVYPQHANWGIHSSGLSLFSAPSSMPRIQALDFNVSTSHRPYTLNATTDITNYRIREFENASSSYPRKEIDISFLSLIDSCPFPSFVGLIFLKLTLILLKLVIIHLVAYTWE